MKTNDLKNKHFSTDTRFYKIVVDFYTEPNKGGNMSRYAFEGFKKGKLILTGVYSSFVKMYCNLGNAIKVGKQLEQNTENAEVSIVGIDHKGITTDWVKLENLK
jgi:hypothetical protein